MKRWVRTLSNKIKTTVLVATLLTAQVAGATLPFIPNSVANAASGDMTVGAFEGQNSDLSWSPGNNTQFAEGDYVNYRFAVSSSANNRSGVLNVHFSTCMFTNYFALYDSAAPAAVAPGTQTSSGGDWIQPLTISFANSGTGTVHFTLRISDTGGDCNGSSSHVSLDTTNQTKGDFGNVGSKDIPIPASSIFYSPSLTLTKIVDSGTAKASEFWFTVSPAVNGQTEIHLPANGTNTSSVTITDVNPDGQFVITEHGPDGYEFEGGTGTNCTVTGTGVMTASVTAGRPAINASCTFTNTRSSGTLRVVKDVVNDNGGTKTYADFHFSVNGGQAQGFDATTSPDGAKSITVPTGTYSVTEPEENTMGYSTSYSNCANVSVVAGQTTTCTITNNDIAPTLTLVKQVSGGTAQATSWTLSANGPTPISGTTGSAAVTNAVVSTGDYTLSEADGPLGYTASTWNCTAGTLKGNVLTLPLATNATCTITNTRDTGTVRVNKTLLPNTDSGRFDLNISGTDNFSYTASNQGDNGTTGARTVNTGTYAVSETGYGTTSLSDYLSSYVCTDGNTTVASGSGPSVSGLSVAKDHAIVCTFTNTRKATISGTKYLVNADGSNAGTIKNWTIYLLVDGSQNPLSTPTAADGSFSFTGLDPSLGYTLSEDTSDNTYTQIYGDWEGSTCTEQTYIISLVAGQNSTNNDFCNFKNASISGYKFNDLNGTNGWDEGEPVIGGWTINLTGTTDTGDPVSKSTSTDGITGQYAFDNLAPGVYTVCEDTDSLPGYVQTYPTTNGGCYDVTINQTGETNPDLNFGNQGHGTITVVKNVNDGFDTTTYDVPGWTWNYDGAYQSGNDVTAGSTNHIAVPAGDYTITENQLSDFHFTSVSCNNDSEVKQSETFDITLNPGDNVTCTFVNTRDTGFVSVTKYLNPEEDDGLFNLNVDANTEATDVSDGGTTGDVRVLTGTHSVSELAGTDTDLGNYDSSYVCWSGERLVLEGEGTLSDDFNVSAGQHVHCYFYNTRHATLTVVKKAFPVNSAQSFHFTLNKVEPADDEENDVNILDFIGDTSLVKGFNLDDNTDPTLPNNNVSSLSPGVYEVKEDSTTGWDLASMDCGDVTTTKTTTSIRFELQAGQQLTCTFVNQKHVVPQVLGEATVLTNTGLPVIAFTLAAMTLFGTALFVGTRRQN